MYIYSLSNTLIEKLKEAVKTILPCFFLVLLLCLFVVGVPSEILLNFIIATILLIIGITLFSLGADLALTPIGNKMGTTLTKTKNLLLILVVGFLLGFSITIAEPDLQVLANSVEFSKSLFVIVVGIGVGLFLTVCLLRMFFGFSFQKIIVLMYSLILIISFFVSPSFFGASFDASGVTTGPMTVPFLLAFGVGISNVRNDEKAKQDSFGLVGLCSIGPIFATMILSFFIAGDAAFETSEIIYHSDTLALGKEYLLYLPSEFISMAISLAPIFIIFTLFQLIFQMVSKRVYLKIFIGLLYTYLGLVFFLTAASVGFSQMGYILGSELSNYSPIFIISLALLLGYLIISAEPAVKILEKQIEEVSAGSIPSKAIHYALCISIALALGIAVIRVIYNIDIRYIIIPMYFISLSLSFFVPEIYSAIAFDSGGVASGPLSATFLLQFILGLQTGLGSSVDAFGVVALIAGMPLLSIQLVGFIFNKRSEKQHIEYKEDEIIELWESEV